MRRAYPQYLAAGGERLPREILQVIFPVDLLGRDPEVRRPRRDLDPYLVAALDRAGVDVHRRRAVVGERVGPDADRPVDGPAATRVAEASGGSRPRMLTDPETNIRLGTRYFADLVNQFGGEHFALASYNAGENRVVRWRAERPGLDREDEFIDDIPFPETQNYVKRILGTAEDYRRLYGDGGGSPDSRPRGCSRGERWGSELSCSQLSAFSHESAVRTADS